MSRPPTRHRTVRTTLRATAIAAPLALFAAAAWFLVTTRVVRNWGPDSAAPAAGLLVALLVAFTIWRWMRDDEELRALGSSTCPRCGEALAVRHDHARAGALAGGLTEWRCEACGYEHSEALTCELCAT
jgi:predicted RNA-binding Zn-ribbon protein involved in translation (DUF1610 family)